MELAATALGTGSLRYEVIVIDDGSVDNTWSVLESLRASYPFLRFVRHRTRRGIADALRTGFHHARGAVLVFYPADLQFLPEEWWWSDTVSLTTGAPSQYFAQAIEDTELLRIDLVSH